MYRYYFIQSDVNPTPKFADVSRAIFTPVTHAGYKERPKFVHIASSISGDFHLKTTLLKNTTVWLGRENEWEKYSLNLKYIHSSQEIADFNKRIE